MATPTIITDGIDNPKIVDSEGILLTGTYNYTVLNGADISTATYVDADKTVITAGVTSILIAGGLQNVGDDMIVMIQDPTHNNIHGAYELTITEVNP